ncbi:MAG: hypothetical protein JST00_32885 [Deltaproteobacteria bacterium]|nr:hypothetical protein [Deltaproteobacteria bacterium]
MSLRGDNYEIEVHGRRATARVWKRPDLDSAEGARNAAAMVAKLTELAASVDSLVFDLREAPLIAGPRTVDALGELFSAYEEARARIAVVTTSEPLQTLQFRRLLSTYAPTMGQLTLSTSEAETWVNAPTSRRQ